MTPKYRSNGKEHILYDAELADQVDGDFFDPAVWQRRNALVGTARGRGAVVFLETEKGEYVLRHYRRGGLPALFSEDRYVWFGLHRTRAWREWHLLVELQAHRLPAPRPVAVRVMRAGWAYRADIVTVRIAGQSLAALLGRESIEEDAWRQIGRCIRRFHEAGVCHADLNAHNILIDERREIYLVDFDRGRFLPPGVWRQSNLDRLQRSLRKLASQDVRFAYSERDWDRLLRGYADG